MGACHVTDMRVMLDLDSETLREMLAKRLYEDHPIHVKNSFQRRSWEEAVEAQPSCYLEADYMLNALRGLAADGLLVRG